MLTTHSNNSNHKNVTPLYELANQTDNNHTQQQTQQTQRQTNSKIEIEKDYYEINSFHLTSFCVLLIGIAILCGTITSSIHYVKYDEYALLKDTYGTVRLSKVYGQGRYFFPLNYEMIYFPANYIGVDFEEKVFTDTGLEFEVEIGFYYRLPRESVGEIYNEFSKSYNDLVVINARTTIKNEAANLDINSYLTNREEVEKIFATSVNQVLKTVLFVDAPISLFKIGQITLPDTIVESSLESAISIQNNELLQNSQAVTVIRAETLKLVTEINVSTSLLLEYSTNEASRIVEQANSYSNQISVKTRGTSLRSLLSSLNFTTNNYTLQIIEKFALLDNSESVTLFGDNINGVKVQVNA